MNKQIYKKARAVRRALRGDLSFPVLKDYIEKEGYTVAFIGSPDGDDLIRRLGLIEHSTKRAFTYVKNIKVIFLQHDLTEFEKVHSILHEIGHIELGHIEMSSYEIDNITAEMQAENFVHEVMFPDNNNKSGYVVAVCAVVLLLSCLAANARFQNKESEIIANEKRPHEAVSYSENISVDDIAVIADADDIVYITPAGKCYHCEDCRYVGTNAISVSLTDVENKYLPCSVCDPQKK